MELEVLDLSKNQISDDKEMLETISSLSSLRRINLNDNCFIEEYLLEKKTLEICEKLESYNMIKVKRSGKTKSTVDKESIKSVGIR